jgi:hypothetical protein
MSKNILLIGVEAIKDRTQIHDNIDEKLIYPEIKTAQDMYIHPILGTALFDKLVTDIDTTGTTTGDYKTLLDNYIVDALVYYVLAALPEALSFQFWNKGVVRKQGDSTELPTMSELFDIASRYRAKAQWYGERLTMYLKRVSSSSVLPEYLSPGDNLDTITPEGSAFSMPIYLGDYKVCQHLDKNNCNCNG